MAGRQEYPRDGVPDSFWQELDNLDDGDPTTEPMEWPAFLFHSRVFLEMHKLFARVPNALDESMRGQWDINFRLVRTTIPDPFPLHAFLATGLRPATDRLRNAVQEFWDIVKEVWMVMPADACDGYCDDDLIRPAFAECEAALSHSYKHDAPRIYMLCDRREIHYVGKSTSVFQRVAKHEKLSCIPGEAYVYPFAIQVQLQLDLPNIDGGMFMLLSVTS